MKQTSRHRILDAVELIGNLIASASHYQELITAVDQSEEKVVQYTEQLKRVVALRRDIMSQLEKQDDEVWCLLKHSIAQYTYATELYYANFDSPFFQYAQEECSSLMYETLSQFLGMEIVKCGRCLNDELSQ